MDRDPYEHSSLPWQESQQQLSDEAPYFTPSRYELDRQKLRVPTRRERMSKEQAMVLVRSLKKGVVVAAIVAFAIFSFLAANFLSVVAHSPFGGPLGYPPGMHQRDHAPDNDDFFHNHHNRGGGYDFGSSNSQPPVSGSNVS